jgi:hypothetical protein
MGNEIQTPEGKVLFETEEIVVRGARRLVIPLKAITAAEVTGDALRITWSGGETVLHAGAATAKKWLEKIRNPKSRLDKLGVKPGQRVSLLGVDELAGELKARGIDVSTRPRKQSDAIFLGAESERDLERIAALVPSLQPGGALWIVRNRASVSEAAAMAAGKAAGLVDVKVVKFSGTHTAEKFVIPLARR